MPPAPESSGSPQPPFRPPRPPSSPWRANRLPPESERFFAPRGHPGDHDRGTTHQYRGRAHHYTDRPDDYHDRCDDYEESRCRHEETRSYHEPRSRQQDSRNYQESRTRQEDPKNYHESRARHDNSRSHHEYKSRHEDKRSYHEPRSRQEDTRSCHEPRSRHEDTRSYHEPKSRHEDTRSYHEPRSRYEDTRSYHEPKSRHEDSRVYVEHRNKHDDTRSYHEPPKDRHEGFRDSRERLDDRRSLHDSRDRLNEFRSHHETSRICRRCQHDYPRRSSRDRLDESRRYQEPKGGRLDSRGRPSSRVRPESRGRPDSRSTISPGRRACSSRPRSNSTLPDMTPSESPTHASMPFSKVKPSARVNPVFLRPKDTYPFVVVNELDGQKTSSKVSPYFPRAFKGHPPRTVMSAPPVRKPKKKSPPPDALPTWQPNPKRRIPRLCNKYGRCQHDTPTRSLAGIVPEGMLMRNVYDEELDEEELGDEELEEELEIEVEPGTQRHDMWNKTSRKVRMAGGYAKSSKSSRQRSRFPLASVPARKFMRLRGKDNKTGVVRNGQHSKQEPEVEDVRRKKLGFPFAPFPAKKFMSLRGRSKPQQTRPPSSSRKMSAMLGLTSLGRMTHSRTKSRRFTSLAKLTRTFGGGKKEPQQTRPPSARKFSAVAGLTNMGIKVTGEVRPDWTVQEDEPQYVSCCGCCRKSTPHESRDKIIRSKSLERMETIDKEDKDNDEEEPKKTKPEKKYCLCCCCGNGESEEEEVEDEVENETEVKPQPAKAKKSSKKKMSCWGRQDSSDDVGSNGTKMSEVDLLPGELEDKDAKTKSQQWAVKTKSQEARDYVPPKKKKKRCFWCCYKTEESKKMKEMQASQTEEPIAKPESGWKGKLKEKNLTKLKSQGSKESELDCNRKCKVCWVICCCGCTCSSKPHTKSMAIQAMSADIRTSMMLLPGQLRVPSTSNSGDAMVIQSLSSADRKLLTAARSVRGASSQGTSKDITALSSMSSTRHATRKTKDGDRKALDPNVQRSVSAVMRHLSPDRNCKASSCFTCCKKSPEVARKSVKRKTNWICCTVRKKKKTTSQESLTSISKLPPEIQPAAPTAPTPASRKRKKKSTKSCWGKRKKMSPEIHPVSARRKRTLGERLCGGGWRRKKADGDGKVPLKTPRRGGGCWGWISKRKKKKKIKVAPKRGADEKQKRSFKSFLCCKKKEEKPKEEQHKQGLCRRMFCCCCKPKLGPAPLGASTEAAAPPAVGGKKNEMPPLKPLTRPNLWKRIFCCKCQRSPDLGSRKSYGSKRGDMASRASSLASFPKLEATLVESSSLMKAAIPVLPICLAWTCLLINVFLPGIGTILSGFLCVCFGKPRFSVKDSTFARLGALCVNIVIGVGQLFTIIFCFVGWGWSIWWGVIMLRLARKYRRIKQAELNPVETPALSNHDEEHGH